MKSSRKSTSGSTSGSTTRKTKASFSPTPSAPIEPENSGINFGKRLVISAPEGELDLVMQYLDLLMKMVESSLIQAESMEDFESQTKDLDRLATQIANIADESQMVFLSCSRVAMLVHKQLAIAQKIPHERAVH